MGILEIRRKWQKTAETLEFHRKREKTGKRGKGENLRIPGNRGPPARPRLAARWISKPQDDYLNLIEIRHGFAVQRPECASFPI